MRLIDDIKPARLHSSRPGVGILRPGGRIGSTEGRYGTHAPIPRQRRVSSIPLPSLRTATGLRIERPHARLKRTITAGIFIMIAVLGVAVLARQPIGLVVVLGYGAFAFIRRIPSRTTLAAALVMIIFVILSLYLFGGRNVVTSALATYAFLLLAIGIITEWRSLSSTSKEV